MPRTSTASADTFEPSIYIPNKVGTPGDKDQDVAAASVARPYNASSTSGAVETAGTYASFRVLKNWEGVVTSVDGPTFTAEMKDTDAPRGSRATDSFEIDLENVAEGDRDLVAEGSVFYLTLG